MNQVVADLVNVVLLGVVILGLIGMAIGLRRAFGGKGSRRVR